MWHWEGLLLYGLMQPTLVIFALVPSSLEADTGALAITPGRIREGNPRSFKGLHRKRDFASELNAHFQDSVAACTPTLVLLAALDLRMKDPIAREEERILSAVA